MRNDNVQPDSPVTRGGAPSPARASGRFPLGELVITSNAAIRLSPTDVSAAIARHANADWGEVDEHDRRANEQALVDGSRLMSVYRGGGERFWIITEADRSVTTVLLPEDY